MTALKVHPGGGAYSPIKKLICFVPCCQSSAKKWYYLDCKTGFTIAWQPAVAKKNWTFYGAALCLTQRRSYFIPYGESSETKWRFIPE